MSIISNDKYTPVFAGTINKTVRLIFKLLKTLGEKIVGLFKK